MAADPDEHSLDNARRVTEEVTDGETAPTAAGKPRARRPTLRLEPGRRVGRYEIVSELGSGGMGVVYMARDPQLARDVALKLVRAPEGEAVDGGSQRLLREAQALAQLSHPNVIAVHDVGLVDDAVFFAMELVHGSDLRAWKAAGERSVDEVIEVFAAAADGLAAAHRAGLVHRDVKPDNLMIGDDGRVRVVDFGLARETGAADDDGAAAPARTTSGSGSGSDRLLGSPITRAGLRIGTPAYMAPEQLRGEPVDARADQFSFCAALYETLHGGVPVSRTQRKVLEDGGSIAAIDVPERDDVPARVTEALARGLQLDPDDRFPSMADVAAALRGEPAGRRGRAGLVAALGALVLGAGALVLAARGGERPAMCRSGADAIARVWNVERELDVRRSFEATGRAYAGDTATRVDAILDAYAAQWADMHREACEATHVHGTQSASLLDLRMQCLDHRREQLDHLVRVWTTGTVDDEMIANAVAAALQLEPISRCADAARLADRAGPPATAAGHAAWQEAHSQLDHALALRLAGRPKDALDAARAAFDTATAAESPYVRARAQHLVGALLVELADYAAGDEQLHAAARAAAALDDDELLADIWIDLVWSVGEEQKRAAEGLALGHNADLALTRAGDPPRLRARYHFTLGALRFVQGDLEATLQEFQRSLALREANLPADHLDIAHAADAVAGALHFLGRHDEAAPYEARARDIRERTLGPNHPEMARTQSELGIAAQDAGKHGEAKRHYETALAIRVGAYGDNHPSVADAYNNLGGLLYEMGDVAGARAAMDKALAIRIAVFGERHSRVAVSYYNFGFLELQEGNAEAAERYFARSVEIYEQVFGPEHVSIADPLTGLGEARLAAGRPADAIPPLERALAIWDAHGHAPRSRKETAAALEKARRAAR